ncbi:hypothetical protein MIR68_008523 [Amoeboaphelidium protococcarum]|nr:hypothetical protein MIR68_008523 [Amoeboaphelidium protococcarum]KAI3644291.1 hypothetical protein MP228_010455 [Amoeboaphelidium protococcarum]
MLFASLICIASVLVNAQKVKFGDEQTKFDGTIGGLGQIIPVSLDKAPDTDNFEVQFGSEDVTIAQCKLVFTRQNWNKPQNLHISAPEKMAAQGTLVYTTPCGKPQNVSLKVVNGKNDAATCSVTGDPHVLSFDGAKYVFTIPKNLLDTPSDTVYYMRSPYLTVQGQQGDCGMAATCTKSLGIRFLDQFILVTTSYSQGKATTTYTPYGNKDRITATVKDNQLLFNINGVAMISVKWGAINNIAYLNNFITLNSAFEKTISGMCGNFNKDGKDCMSIEQCGALVPPAERITNCAAGRCPQAIVLQKCKLPTQSASCAVTTTTTKVPTTTTVPVSAATVESTTTTTQKATTTTSLIVKTSTTTVPVSAATVESTSTTAPLVSTQKTSTSVIGTVVTTTSGAVNPPAYQSSPVVSGTAVVSSSPAVGSTSTVVNPPAYKSSPVVSGTAIVSSSPAVRSTSTVVNPPAYLSSPPAGGNTPAYQTPSASKTQVVSSTLVVSSVSTVVGISTETPTHSVPPSAPTPIPPPPPMPVPTPNLDNAPCQALLDVKVSCKLDVKIFFEWCLDATNPLQASMYVKAYGESMHSICETQKAVTVVPVDEVRNYATCEQKIIENPKAVEVAKDAGINYGNFTPIKDVKKCIADINLSDIQDAIMGSGASNVAISALFAAIPALMLMML